jgi:uncharacterized membrane protein YfcA
VIDLQVVTIALLIGACSVPGAFLARRIVERMPVRLHAAVLDAVILIGGAAMVLAAVR